MTAPSDDDWFLPKQFGYGAGLPIAWQGWALLIGYIAVVIGATVTLATRHPQLFIAIIVVVTIPLIVISAQHTRGGWRWRWGGED